MNEMRPDQIYIECMDCGRVRIGRRLDNAPLNATLYKAHCGCRRPIKVGGTKEPYYLDANGKHIDWSGDTALLDGTM
jgi:hypothetical protein